MTNENWSVLSLLKSSLLQGHHAESVEVNEQPGIGTGTLLGSKVERRDDKRDPCHQAFQSNKTPDHHHNLLIKKVFIKLLLYAQGFSKSCH